MGWFRPRSGLRAEFLWEGFHAIDSAAGVLCGGVHAIDSAVGDVREGSHAEDKALGAVRVGLIPGHLREGGKVLRLIREAAGWGGVGHVRD